MSSQQREATREAVMRYRTVGIMMAALLVAGVACGGDDTGPSGDDLVGTWQASKLELVSVANPATKVELIASGGALELVLNETRTFSMTQSAPGSPDEVTTGTWSASIDVLTLTYGMGTYQFDMVLSSNTLTLTGADGSYDFNGDDTDEPARINLTLHPQ
jgi:hypothetical protein